jgi:hypothetical protein
MTIVRHSSPLLAAHHDGYSELGIGRFSGMTPPLSPGIGRFSGI